MGLRGVYIIICVCMLDCINAWAYFCMRLFMYVCCIHNYIYELCRYACMHTWNFVLCIGLLVYARARARACVCVCVQHISTRGSITFKPIMHIAYSPYFREIYKFPLFLQICFNPLSCFQFTVFGLIYVFCFPLYWPWCINASCNARTGRLCVRIMHLCRFLHSSISKCICFINHSQWMWARNRTRTVCY